jgi:hypothetical protein
LTKNFFLIMPKKCIICREEAEFAINGTSDYYCKGCAEENFADLALLKRVESQARKLNMIVQNKARDISNEAVGEEESTEENNPEV